MNRATLLTLALVAVVSTVQAHAAAQAKPASPLAAGDGAALAAAVAPEGGARLLPAGAGAHYELIGLAATPDPYLVAALAGWCAERGLLITELRLGSASLEERYLELVGTDVAAEAEGAACARTTGRPASWEPASPPVRRRGSAWRSRWRPTSSAWRPAAARAC